MKQIKIIFVSLLLLIIAINPTHSYNLINKQEIITYQGFARPCMTINSKYIIINTNKEKKDYWNVGKKYVTCFNYLNGSAIWKKFYKEEEKITDLQCNDKYLILRIDSMVSDTNFVGYDTKIICFNIETGNENWQKKYETRSYEFGKSPGSVPSFFLLQENKISYYFEKKVYFIDVPTGRETQFELGKKNECTPVANYKGNTIFITSDGLCSLNEKQIVWTIDRETFNPTFIYDNFQSLGFGWNDYGISYNRDQKPYNEGKSLLLNGYKDYQNENLSEFVFAKVDMETGTIEEIFKSDENEFSGKPFLVSDNVVIPVHDFPKSIKCFNRKLNLLWETKDEKKYYSIGLYNNKVFALDTGVERKDAKTICAFNLSDGKNVWKYESSYNKIENAVMYGSNLFLFGDGKLQKIDLSQIDFSTKLQFNPTQGTYTQNGTTYQLDTPIEIVNNRVFISANNIFEPLCGKNKFENKEGIIKATLDDKTIELQINNPTAKINGAEKQIDPNNQKVTPYVNSEGYIMVPLRFVAESFGCKITFNPDIKEIIVTYQP